MELTEKGVEIVFGVIEDELVPEIWSGDRAVFLFEIINDFLEIPWESEHISMLLLAKFHIDP